MEELSLKEKFVKWMIPLCGVSSNGKAIFTFSTIQHDGELRYIFTDPNYIILKRKMKNLLKLINKDHKYGYMDIETELWDKI